MKEDTGGGVDTGSDTLGRCWIRASFRGWWWLSDAGPRSRQIGNKYCFVYLSLMGWWFLFLMWESWLIVSLSNRETFYCLLCYSNLLVLNYVTSFTLRAFSRHFYPIRLTIVDMSEEGATIYRWRYSKVVCRNTCQELTIAKLLHSPYTTKIARFRCYTTKYYF